MHIEKVSKFQWSNGINLKYSNILRLHLTPTLFGCSIVRLWPLCMCACVCVWYRCVATAALDGFDGSKISTHTQKNGNIYIDHTIIIAKCISQFIRMKYISYEFEAKKIRKKNKPNKQTRETRNK